MSNDEDFVVLAHFNNCNEAAAVISGYEPDAVLMDIDMPGMSGIQGVVAIKAVRPQTAVIMYTVLKMMIAFFNACAPEPMDTCLRKRHRRNYSARFTT